MTMRLGAAVLAAVTLILGFFAANASGNTTFGGVVLIIGGAICAYLWWKMAGIWRALACVAIAGVALAVSHPLGAMITSWGSVLLVSGVTGGAAYLITRPTPVEASRSSSS